MSKAPSGYNANSCDENENFGDGGEGESQADYYVTPDGQVIPGAVYNLPEFDGVTTQAVLITYYGETVYFNIIIMLIMVTLSKKLQCTLVAKFRKGINHPGGSDLIYYPEMVGLPKNPTVDEIVDLAIKGVSSETNNI